MCERLHKAMCGSRDAAQKLDQHYHHRRRAIATIRQDESSSCIFSGKAVSTQWCVEMMALSWVETEFAVFARQKALSTGSDTKIWLAELTVTPCSTVVRHPDSQGFGTDSPTRRIMSVTRHAGCCECVQGSGMRQCLLLASIVCETSHLHVVVPRGLVGRALWYNCEK